MSPQKIPSHILFSLQKMWKFHFASLCNHYVLRAQCLFTLMAFPWISNFRMKMSAFFLRRIGLYTYSTCTSYGLVQSLIPLLSTNRYNHFILKKIKMYHHHPIFGLKRQICLLLGLLAPKRELLGDLEGKKRKYLAPWSRFSLLRSGINFLWKR